MSDLRTRFAGSNDIDSIASLHKGAFPGFFLSLMGERFLGEYYRLVLEGDDGIVLVGEDEGGLVGFVAGSVDPAGFYRRMSANKFRLILPIVAAAIRRPVLLGRIVFNIRKIRREGRSGNLYEQSTAELTSIAVDPRCGGRGVGGGLLTAFLEYTRELESKKVRLTTDTDDNDPVNAFYVANGFLLCDTKVTSRGRRMNVYEIDL